MKRVTTVQEFPEVIWVAGVSGVDIDGALQALIACDISDFRVIDDRGGSGDWLIFFGDEYDRPDVERALNGFAIRIKEAN